MGGGLTPGARDDDYVPLSGGGRRFRCTDEVTHSNDRLASHLTTWKAWCAIPASLTLLVTSLIPAIAGGFLDPDAPSTKTVMVILIPVQFIAFAALALSFIALRALAFALPHLGDSLTGRRAIA